MSKTTERSVLYAVYELLPGELQSRFFTLTAGIWREHYTSIPKDVAGQRKAYKEYARKQRIILNKLLEEAWGVGV
jgi:hypothetical protein